MTRTKPPMKKNYQMFLTGEEWRLVLAALESHAATLHDEEDTARLLRKFWTRCPSDVLLAIKNEEKETA